MQLIDYDTRHVSTALTNRINEEKKNNKRQWCVRTESAKMSEESVGSRSNMPLDHFRLSSWWATNLPRPITQLFKIPLEKRKIPFTNSHQNGGRNLDIKIDNWPRVVNANFPNSVGQSEQTESRWWANHNEASDKHVFCVLLWLVENVARDFWANHQTQLFKRN